MNAETPLQRREFWLTAAFAPRSLRRPKTFSMECCAFRIYPLRLPALRRHSPITIPRIWKVRDEVRVASKRPCERSHVTSNLPDDDFLLRAEAV
jgi:hypothetical protein